MAAKPSMTIDESLSVTRSPWKKMFSFLRKKEARRVHVASRNIEFGVMPGMTLLEAMLASRIAMPHDCKVGTCGTCRYRLLDGKIGELSPSALSLSREELAGGYRLACQSIPRSDLVIAVDHLGDEAVAIEEFEAEIVSTPRLSHDIIGLTLRLDRPISFSAGQYADLSVHGIEGGRSYSFAFAPAGRCTDTVQFHVRKVPGGAFTEWLFGTDQVGTSLRLSGPRGRFRLHEANAPILCVAGGSGLAPILAILQQAHWAGIVRPATLLYGARAEKDLYCKEEIFALQQDWRASFRYVPVLSAEPKDSGWTGYRGLVSDHVAAIPDMDAHHAYLCGPPPMVDAAEAALQTAGIAPEAIHADRFYDRSRHTA